MSYTKFKNKSTHREVFAVDSQVTKIRSYPDSKLNLILPSEFMFKSLQPVLERMVQGELDDKKVVLIPNGGLGSDRAHMSYVYLDEFTTINNMYLKQLDLDKWPLDIIKKALDAADVISISGGLVSRLLTSIDKAGIREYLIQLINEGKPFVGFSAGAMCLARTTHFAEKFIGEEDPAVATLQPLGIVNFELYPHFEDTLLPLVQALLPPSVKGYALRPEDALIVTGGELLQAGAPVEIH